MQISDDQNSINEALNNIYRCLTLIVPKLYFHTEVNLFLENQYGPICKLVVSNCDTEIALFSICPRETPVHAHQERCS